MRQALIFLSFVLWGAALDGRAGDPPPPPAEEAPQPAQDGGIIGRRPAADPSRSLADPLVARGDAVRMILSLAAVLAALVGGVWFLRRMVPGVKAAGANRLIEILSRTAVGPKQSVVLLRVGSRMILVGVTSDSVRMLSEFGEGAEIERLIPAVPGAAAKGGAFGEKVRQMMTVLRPTPVGEFEAEEAVEFRVRREIDAIRRKLSSWEDEERSAPVSGGPTEGGTSGAGRSA